MNTAIIIHGYNLQATEWHKYVWGQPPNKLGRVTKAIHVLLETELYASDKITFMQFGGGGSYDDKAKLYEGEITYNLLMNNVNKLTQFALLQPLIKKYSLEKLKHKLQEISIINISAKNTYCELLESKQYIDANMCEKVILISSPFHISRCLRDAILVYPEKIQNNLIAMACTYENHNTPNVKNVIIFEPNHHPDKLNSWSHIVVKLFNIPANKYKQCASELMEIINKYIDCKN